MSRHIAHVTLNTGHRRDSPRAEADLPAVAVARASLEAALASPAGRGPIDGLPGLDLMASNNSKCLLATVLRGDIPLITYGVARHSRDGAKLWHMLHDSATVPLRSDPDRRPPEPWCAARMDGGLRMPQDADLSVRLGAYGRCLGWAWLLRLEDR